MVTICIPTYFGSPLVNNCVDSIFRNVANPKILVYKNDIGWLKACNELMHSTVDDVILLNDDTIILTDIVQEMKTLAYSSEDIGIVGGKSLAPDGQYVNNFGIYLGNDGNTAHKYFGVLKDTITEPVTQKAVEGSCIYIKREVIDEIGVFDEGFGMGYRAEVDYCLTARKAGYKIISSPRAEYIHLVSQTSHRLNIANDTHKIFMEKWGAELEAGIV